MKGKNKWRVMLTGCGLLLLLVSAAAADEAVIKVPEENIRSNPNATGERLGTLVNAIKFTVLERQPSWYRGEATFYIWAASVTAGANNTATVSVDRENIRSGPPERVKIGTLQRGVSFTVIERADRWVKGKITFWVWGPSVAPLVATNKMEAIRCYWRAREYFERANAGAPTYGLARQWVKKAIEFEPIYPQAYFLLGLIYRSQTDPDTVAALAAYHKTIALNADYAEAYVNIANIYLLDDNFDSAIRYYRAAITHNRDLDQAYFSLAETLHALDRDTDAVAVYEVFAQVKPENATSYYNIACIYALAGQREAALEWFRRGAPHMEMGVLDGALRDADLALVREDAEFLRIIDEAKASRRAAGQP